MLTKASQHHYEFAPAQTDRASEGLPGLTKRNGLALPTLQECQIRDQRRPRPLIGDNLPPLTANIESGFQHLAAPTHSIVQSFATGEPAPLRPTALSARSVGQKAFAQTQGGFRGLPAIDMGCTPRGVGIGIAKVIPNHRHIESHIIEREEPEIEAACKQLWAATHAVALYISREVTFNENRWPVDPLGRQNAIKEMIRTLNVPGVTKALRQGGKINWHNPETNGETLLQRSARHGEVLVMRYLLERKADPSIVDFGGRNALHWACVSGQAKAVKLLIEQLPRSSAVDQEEDEGNTALHLASLSGHVHCVRLLMRAKADPDAMNFNDETPLDLAFCANHHTVVRHLLLCHTDDEEMLLQEMDRECNVARRQEIMVKLAKERSSKKKKKKKGGKDGEGKKKGKKK